MVQFSQDLLHRAESGDNAGVCRFLDVSDTDTVEARHYPNPIAARLAIHRVDLLDFNPLLSEL